MDYNSLGIAAAIGVYGLIEYRRREQIHQEMMDYLYRGLEPQARDRKPPMWTMVTTGGTALLLLASVIFFAYLGVRENSSAVTFFGLSGVFALLLILLLGVLFNNIRAYRGKEKEDTWKS